MLPHDDSIKYAMLAIAWQMRVACSATAEKPVCRGSCYIAAGMQEMGQ